MEELKDMLGHPIHEGDRVIVCNDYRAYGRSLKHYTGKIIHIVSQWDSMNVVAIDFDQPIPLGTGVNGIPRVNNMRNITYSAIKLQVLNKEPKINADDAKELMKLLD